VTKKILITGVSGLIGSVIWNWLNDKNRYDLYGLARRFDPSARINPTTLPAIENEHHYLVNITNFDEVLEAASDKDVIVHMAADPRGDAPWDIILKDNIIGTYNVFQAAKEAGVQRVIYASTVMVSWNYLSDEPYKSICEGLYDNVPPDFPIITKDMPVKPHDFYSSSKVLAESLAHKYSKLGMSMLGLRIGGVNKADRPADDGPASPLWCSQRDVAQMVERCIEADKDLQYDIFYVLSNNRWGFMDIEHARRTIGYEPQDSTEDFE